MFGKKMYTLVPSRTGHRRITNVNKIFGSTVACIAGFCFGIIFVNWCKISVVSHCGLKGVCCKEIHLIYDPSINFNKMPSGEQKNLVKNLSGVDNFIFIGIMTAKKFIDNRGLASHRTWANSINGKVMFFSSEGSVSNHGVPVVALPDVDDRYPPQKKSFMMLKYMHDHYIDKYEWFMRADDDVFIKGDKLDQFLRGINSSQARFIGQAGTGKAEELGKLSLMSDENFCMGGPGMIFSRQTLRLMAPHISYCLKNLYTSHEDVEIGRCVRKFAHIQCTWAYEMQQILYQNYKEERGSFKNTLKNKEVQKAVSLHPVKDPVYQYRIFNYLLSGKIMNKHQREIYLHREIALMSQLVQDGRLLAEPSLSLQPSLHKFYPLTDQEVIAWEFFDRSLYSPLNSNPKRGVVDSLKIALEGVINQIMLKVNRNAHLRGRSIDFKQIEYGYQRINPIHGPDYILDILLSYRKFRGRKIAMSVRRHAYLQQTFLPFEFLELSGNNSSKVLDDGVKAKVLSWINNFSGVDSQDELNIQDEKIDMIMPLMGRFQIFKRFMQNYETICLKKSQNTRLIIVLYQSAEDPDAFQQTLDLVHYYHETYGYRTITIVKASTEFSRGSGLQLGVLKCAMDSLLFFIDVDIIFTTESLQRVRLNTRKGFQVYFPIVFSQYDPQPVCYSGSEHCECFDGKCYLKANDINEDAGYWRQFGFGIAAMYRSDYHNVGGFDLSIQGWGKEDVDLYTKFIERNYAMFRAVDPGMTHIFHSIACNSNLVSNQMTMCENSRAQSYASTYLLAQYIYKTPEILRRLEKERF